MANYRPWIIGALAVAGVGFFGFRYWQDQKANELPAGIASGNGRIEARLADIAPKEALRVKDVLVKEGDLVQPGQVVVQMDTVTLDAQLAEADARVAAAKQQLAVVNAAIAKAKSEHQLAMIEVDRVQKMLQENASSQREYDVRRTSLATTQSGIEEQVARLDTAKQQVLVALANVQTIKTRINDATLVSPVQGRVLYRLAEPGEVLAAGAKALTLVNLEDVYMEIFLPSQQAGAMKIGSEGRITLDTQPDKSVVSYVTFVSPEAQFTPKEVETKSERDKLMFRVKLQVPKELVGRYIESIKTGVRGVGYVKYASNADWPQRLKTNVVTVSNATELGAPPPANAPAAAVAPPAAATTPGVVTAPVPATK